MNKVLKNALDVARANYDSIKQQHATAEAKKDAIIKRRPALNKALEAAAERLETAQLGNMRGIVDDSEVATARSEYQAARDALVQQNNDEELSVRALNMADEFQTAKETIEAARTKYFGEISERIEKSLSGDTQLRSRLVSIMAANACIQGSPPEWNGFTQYHPQWEAVLFLCFPLPTDAEVQRGYSEFIKNHDAGSAITPAA